MAILVPYLPVLLLGRVLGGVSTSILYSAFESWLISASNSLALSQSDLSSIMGRASLVNGFVAAATGVISNELVAATGSFASPFVASGALLLLGWVVIKGTWTENYGSGGGTTVASSDVFQLRRLGQAWKIVRTGRHFHPQAQPHLISCIATRTVLDGHRSHADMLRRIYVPLRLQLGTISPRGRQGDRQHTPFRLHFLLIHGLHDDRVSILYLHRLLLPTIRFQCARRTANTTCKAQLTGVRCECSVARGEHREQGRARALLGVLCVRRLRRHVLPCTGHVAGNADLG